MSNRPPITGVILDLDEKGENASRVEFVVFKPIGESVQPNYELTTVRGRSEPHQFYSDTGINTYTVAIELHASVDQDDGGTPEKIMQDAMVIKSWAYPDYGQVGGGVNLVRPPHRLSLKVGNIIRGATGFLKNPSLTYHPPYDFFGLPYRIEISFTFDVQNARPLDYRGVRSSFNAPSSF